MNKPKTLSLTIFIASVILISSCQDSSPDGVSLSDIDIRNPRTALEQANTLGILRAPMTSFLLHDRIVFEDEHGESIQVPLPNDVMVLAIAPFVENTHSCTYHYMSSCRGELPLSDFTVSIKQTDGDFSADLSVTTLENGFLELWLPKDGTFEVTIADSEHIASEVLSTFSADRTCEPDPENWTCR